MSGIGDFPLHDAAADGDLIRLQILLHLGRAKDGRKLDIDEVEGSGQTALHVAVQCGHEMIVKLLVDLEANTSIKDKNGTTAAAMAAQLGLKEILNLLSAPAPIPDGSDLWVSMSVERQKRLHFPVHIAACRGKQEHVNKGLTNQSSRLHEQDLAGCTALLLAAACGHLDIVQLLLDRGANPDVPAKDGSTTLNAAQRNKQWDVVLFLKKGRPPTPPKQPAPEPEPEPDSEPLEEPLDCIPVASTSYENGFSPPRPARPSPTSSPPHPLPPSSRRPPSRSPPSRSPPNTSPSRQPGLNHPRRPSASSDHGAGSEEDSYVSYSDQVARSRKPLEKKAFMSPVREFAPLELSKATAGYSPANLLGQGAFGKVFKGVLTDKTVVAVKAVDWKKLEAAGSEGARESAELQFRAEAEIVALVQHRHLVQLLGYCLQAQHWLLVLEYMHHGSLSSQLFGVKGTPLNWARRMKIALGSAKGICYLHEECTKRIIHRDIKTANILLTEDYEAKIADFGFAKVGPKEGSSFSTMNVAGTFGYMPKECLVFGEKQSERSDVYSFGVVLLELVTGRKPLDTSKTDLQRSLVVWAQSLPPGIPPQKYVDPRLKGYNASEVAGVFSIALQCVDEEPQKRPTMGKVVRMLEDAAKPPVPEVPKERPVARYPPPPGSFSLQSNSASQSVIQPLTFDGPR